MRPFVRLTAVAAPIGRRDVNTDTIFPARFMRKPRGPEYGRYLFHDLRFTPEGEERPDFVLNKPPYRTAGIIVADANFGCGSSRETAVYALGDFGIRALIAPSYGDIFAANCVKNGLLPVRLDDDTVAAIRAAVAARPGTELTVDLENQTVTQPDGATHRFEIGVLEKECLVAGLDEIDLTLRHLHAIEAFERRYRATCPWASAPSSASSPDSRRSA